MGDDRSGESALLAALAAGDQGAFWPLWAAHAGRLFAICMREMGGNRADAEDALGEAMLRAIAKLPRHAPRIQRVEHWLIRLTLNVCTDVYRRRARRMKLSAELEARAQDRIAAADAGDPPAVSSDEADPAELIARLPDRLREVFVLRVLNQLRYDEIAARLQLSSANARKRVQQARAALRAMRDAPHEISDSENRERAS